MQNCYNSVSSKNRCILVYPQSIKLLKGSETHKRNMTVSPQQKHNENLQRYKIKVYTCCRFSVCVYYFKFSFSYLH